MYDFLEKIIIELANWLWGWPMIILLSLVGVYFTIRLKGIQFSEFFKAGKLTYTKRTGTGKGNITPLQSLFAALGGIIGNGNLAGAATALFMGGPGALFWMWIGAFVGMVIVYTETYLSLKNREISSDGTYSGGPMYYITKLLKLKWLATAFALSMGFKALITTSTIQSNSVSLAASSVFDLSWFPDWIPDQLPFCILLALFTWLVITKGLNSIAKVLEKVTPFMVLLYIFFGLIIVVVKSSLILDTIELVFTSAFSETSVSGGFTGATVMMAVRYGVARGFFSNEAGTGSAAIMFSTSKTDNIYYQSLISMFGVFIDTVVSTFTLFVILITGAWTSGLTSTALTTSAFNTVFGELGGYIIFISSFLLGYSTLIAWSFYGEQCFAYLWGPKMKKIFRWSFSFMILFGFMKVELIWSIADILNASILITNLTALIFLIKYVVIDTKIYRRNY